MTERKETVLRPLAQKEGGVGFFIRFGKKSEREKREELLRALRDGGKNTGAPSPTGRKKKEEARTPPIPLPKEKRGGKEKRGNYRKAAGTRKKDSPRSGYLGGKGSELGREGRLPLL